jgi:hypothetical protein
MDRQLIQFSLIGRETLYVVAEATRSLHLGDNSVCDNDGDRLWMGCSNGPVAGTLCEVGYPRILQTRSQQSWIWLSLDNRKRLHCTRPRKKGIVSLLSKI